MPSRVLVTGVKGQLGSELQQLADHYSQYDFSFSDRESLDLSDINSIDSYLADRDFDIIINCAAYTAVDLAESEEHKANQINHLAVAHLARRAKEKKIKLVQISTDYVFDGKNYRPYLENDSTNPQSVYGKTKLLGENALRDINPKNSIIIRTSWVYSSFGANFVKTMLRLGKERDELGVIFDQVGTPTYAYDLAKTILEILPQLDNEQVETYHYSNEGVCSWYDFAKSIFEIEAMSCDLKPIETSQYPTPAARPHYSLLNKAKIKKEYNITIPYWKDSLKECLKLIPKDMDNG